MAAVVFAPLACAINDQTDAASYTSPSITPPTSGMVVGFIYTRGNGVPATAPTVSGWGLFWKTITSVTRTNDLLTLVAAKLTGATAGAITISYGGVTQLACSASFTRATNVALGADVATAFVQTVTAGTGAATSGSLTFAAPANSQNRAIVGVWHEANEPTTPRTNWTEGDDLSDFGNVRDLEVQWRADAFETTASASWTTSSAFRLIGAEIQAFLNSYTLTASTASYALTGQPVTLSKASNVTILPAILRTSNLEITCTLVEKTLNGSATYANYRANAIANMPGIYARLASFIDGFGETALLTNWDGTGTVPTVNEIRGGKNVFDVSGIDRFYANATALGIPMDWIIWRLPWQFTESPEGVASTASDYYQGQGERRRLRRDATTVANYKLFMRRLGKYLMENCAARRFKNGSEVKGYQQDTFHTPPLGQTYDYNYYYDFYAATVDALLLAADDAVGVTRSDIIFIGPYTTSKIDGGTASPSTLISFDSRSTVTAPVQSIRYKDDAVPPTWNVNQPAWGNPNKASWQLFMEFFKLCANGGTPVHSAAWDYHLNSADGVIKMSNDFSNAERRVRELTRFVKRALDDINGGQYAALKDWLDMTEVYWQAQSTIVDTNNTTGGVKPPPTLPEGYLTPAKAFEYMGAIKAIALAVCVEEGVRTPCFWSPNGRADFRTTPPIDQGQGGFLDEQERYGAAIIGWGQANEGTRTVIGDIIQNVNQKFGLGKIIRQLTVSDSSAIYALASNTDCMLVNKTGTTQRTRINGGAPQTLSAYQTSFVTYANSYTLTAASGALALSGQAATLKHGYRLPATVATLTLTLQAALLPLTRKLSATQASMVLSGQAVTLKVARTLAAAMRSYAVAANDARLIKQPPTTLIADRRVFAVTGFTANLAVTRILHMAAGALTLTAQSMNLLAGRKLSAAQGSYALTGPGVALRAARLLTANRGNLALNGRTALLFASRRLIATQASVALSGQSARLLRMFRLASAPGVFVESGQGTGLFVARLIVAAQGSLSFTGKAAGLSYTPLGDFLLLMQMAQVALDGSAASLSAQRRLTGSTSSFAITGEDVALGHTLVLVAAGASYVLGGIGAVLTPSILPEPLIAPENIYAVPPEKRVFAVEYENRIYAVV